MPWSDVPTLILKAWRYVLGDQTRKEASLEADGERALEATKQARTAAELNAADADLQRVHDRARAARGE